MQIVAIKQCWGLVYYVWVEGALLRLDELSIESLAGHEGVSLVCDPVSADLLCC